ncbi:uncharacterized protein LOC135827045 [Sycon ciliatum]|uniref:uncharacterized protein LOC135827045 n=1 Tax=Sycon ciliatum TaxID=27933 RepID=UPI0031F6CB96
MPPLPKERVQRSEPFYFTAMDILGPLLFSTEGSQPNKLWVCLFTCLSTRAIHLEWMDDMTTETFLDCLRLFISRRGCPANILSDNAPQFKVASTILNNRWAKIVRDQQVAAFSQHNNLQWKFTTEYAPWMGGVYERMVGRVKRSLRKTIGRQLLTKPKLITLLTEIEATVNSRPLTYVAGEEDFGTIITPAYLLNVKAPSTMPTADPDQEDPRPLSTSAHLESQLRRQEALEDMGIRVPEVPERAITPTPPDKECVTKTTNTWRSRHHQG